MSATDTGEERRRAVLDLHPECREMIRRGALVALNISGGKDSQAMAILLSRIVPCDQLVAVHAPLGEVEWPGTIAHIENTIPPGVPLVMAHVTSGKTLLEQVEERGMWPSKSARWCTSGVKRGPIERELRRYLKAHPRFEGRLVNALGIRRDESRDRARRISGVPQFSGNDRCVRSSAWIWLFSSTQSTSALSGGSR